MKGIGGIKMIYLKKCPKCAKETQHRISKVNVRRGVKLGCLECGEESLKYYNIKKLKEALQ